MRTAFRSLRDHCRGRVTILKFLTPTSWGSADPLVDTTHGIYGDAAVPPFWSRVPNGPGVSVAPPESSMAPALDS
jgi:hypothetical protein